MNRLIVLESKINYKELNREIKIVETAEQYRSDAVKSVFVSPDQSYYLEYVPINQEHTLWLAVDEDGIAKDLDFNFLCEIGGGYRIDPIFGTAVFIRTKPMSSYKGIIDDLDVLDLTEEDIEYVKNMLTAKNQYSLYLQYEKQRTFF